MDAKKRANLLSMTESGRKVLAREGGKATFSNPVAQVSVDNEQKQARLQRDTEIYKSLKAGFVNESWFNIQVSRWQDQIRDPLRRSEAGLSPVEIKAKISSNPYDYFSTTYGRDVANQVVGGSNSSQSSANFGSRREMFLSITETGRKVLEREKNK